MHHALDTPPKNTESRVIDQKSTLRVKYPKTQDESPSLWLEPIALLQWMRFCHWLWQNQYHTYHCSVSISAPLPHHATSQSPGQESTTFGGCAFPFGKISMLAKPWWEQGCAAGNNNLPWLRQRFLQTWTSKGGNNRGSVPRLKHHSSQKQLSKPLHLSWNWRTTYGGHPFSSLLQEHSPIQISNTSKNLAFGSSLTGAD